MNTTTPVSRPRHAALRGVAVLLAVLQLAGSAMAASEFWHGLVHHDESASSHQCLATLLQHGQVESGGDVQHTVDPPLLQVIGSRPQARPVAGLLIPLLPPGRAPPV